jgi:lipopolysaccharide/colanic/teichoic acid biosynthesis glycosyltransferase
MYALLKRVLDLILSTIALLILSPILIPVIVGLKLTGEGYIFYLQKRMGYKNVYFDIFKFATMLKNSPNMSTGTITMRNDPRVTPMGTFLRKTKINELPQIINVLKGDMSIVGPRPVDIRAFEAYSPEIQAKIYNSKPGITGIGSIIFRDEEHLISASSLPPYEYYKQFVAPHKGALEMWYQEHKSISTDIKLIFLTLWVIIFPKSSLINSFFRDLPKRHF